MSHSSRRRLAVMTARKIGIVFCIAILALGTTCLASEECDPTDVTLCYESFVHYEGLGFPLYGAGGEELDKTCKGMNLTFECMSEYILGCHGNPNCDEACNTTIDLLTSVIQNSGLQELHDELCYDNKILRQTYLENYECLLTNAEKYTYCHNYSQMSQEHMKTDITDPVENLQAKCCFFSWYEGCFVNFTMDSCGTNATFWVSYAMHILMGRAAEQICGRSTTCDMPPLPKGAYIPWPTDKPDNTNNIEDNTVDGGALAAHKGTSSVMIAVLFFVLCLVS